MLLTWGNNNQSIKCINYKALLIFKNNTMENVILALEKHQFYYICEVPRNFPKKNCPPESPVRVGREDVMLTKLRCSARSQDRADQNPGALLIPPQLALCQHPSS
ncbi:hypothetical protein H1C71_019060 [Ictidomys tridecemlineatus]|nr:hypothetical protein H1C71_019060 [Ictidomys tridecemlineatus]